MHADRRATYALAVLTFINLFNYIDRWVIAALVEPVKRELGLSDTRMGLIGTAFVAVYALASPIFGKLGDEKSRPPLIALGVAIWSLATGLAGAARGFWTLVTARALVGVGEAAYGTIAPPLLADHFPYERRGRVMAMFFAAVPVGSAAGLVLGGLADKYFGWRAAFWIAGFPGLLLTLLVLFVKDAPREKGGLKPALRKNTTYILTILGYAAYTFALGGLAFWMAAFLERERGMSREDATVTFGAIVLVTGFLGTFFGGWLGDRLLPKTRQSYLWVSGIATILAAPLTFIGLSTRSMPLYFATIALAEVLVFMCTGPVNSAIVNSVSPLERATAVGFAALTMHILGNIPAPTLIGFLSDRSSLERALQIVPVAMLVAGCIWAYAAWQGERTT